MNHMRNHDTHRTAATQGVSKDVVHDLKNLLSIVIGYSTILISELPDNDPRRSDLLEIHHAAEGAFTLVAQLPQNRA